MRKILILLLLFGGCELKINDSKINDSKINNFNSKKYSMIDIDNLLRQQNYNGGSCVHAAMITVLRWQHLDNLADRWRDSFSGGEGEQGLISKSDSLGLNIAYTTNGDESFLEWCDRTRRGAVIFYYPAHSITFCGYSNGFAYVLDNNQTNRFITIPKPQFITEWKSYGGFALTPVYSPSPPKPRL